MLFAFTQATMATLVTGVQAKNIDALDEQSGSGDVDQSAANPFNAEIAWRGL